MTCSKYVSHPTFPKTSILAEVANNNNNKKKWNDHNDTIEEIEQLIKRYVTSPRLIWSSPLLKAHLIYLQVPKMKDNPGLLFPRELVVKHLSINHWGIPQPFLNFCRADIKSPAPVVGNNPLLIFDLLLKIRGDQALTAFWTLNIRGTKDYFCSQTVQTADSLESTILSKIQI